MTAARRSTGARGRRPLARRPAASLLFFLLARSRPPDRAQGRVTAPSDAHETSAAYFASTPLS